jgi:hypothetical protein
MTRLVASQHDDSQGEFVTEWVALPPGVPIGDVCLDGLAGDVSAGEVTRGPHRLDQTTAGSSGEPVHLVMFSAPVSVMKMMSSWRMPISP